MRLCAVAPDGASLLVTRGLLNLTHRDGHGEPEPLEPRPALRRERAARRDRPRRAGRATRCACPCRAPYWPWAWPSPEPVTLTLHDGRLLLPVRPPRDEPEPPPFAAPEWAEPLEVEAHRAGPDAAASTATTDQRTHEIAFEWDVGGHRRRLVEAGTEMDDTNVTTYRIVDGDPLSAAVEARCSSALARDGWHARVDTAERDDRDRERVPRDPAPRRLRGRRAGLLAHVGAVVPARRRLIEAGRHPALELADQLLAGQHQAALLERARAHAALHRLDEHAVLGADLVVELQVVGDPVGIGVRRRRSSRGSRRCCSGADRHERADRQVRPARASR